jgi:DNA-binding IclR family transcriptional regulator
MPGAISRSAILDGFPAVEGSRRRGLIEKSETSRDYALGDRTLVLGRKLAGTLSTAELLRPAVTKLARESGHSATYFEFGDDANRLVVKHEVADGFHYMREGADNTNFDAHGVARLLLPYQSDVTIERIWDKHVSTSGWNKADFLAKLATARADRYLISLTDDKDYVTRVVAPVFAQEQFAGALAVTLLGADKSDMSCFENCREAICRLARKAGDMLSGV